jgi:myo-inositol-1(or 4)-monophosphatase
MWPSRPPAPPARSSTAPPSTSRPCASPRSRSTTSSPKSTTPASKPIIETLLGAYPDHGILAEESGSEHGAKDSEFVWIIDPLDGTTNFIHGFPVYCVSIALSVRGKIEQAVVYDPTRNDLFTATKGRGAYMNERRIRVSKRVRLNEC